MIFKHEIPQGGKLYFGKSARIKRKFENLVSDILYHNGYEEIATPTFTFLEHQRDSKSREVIRLNNQFNHPIVLRTDSTIETFRILKQRLGASHKKWFYIQPVFSYPTTEINQIGAENLETSNTRELLALCLEIIKEIQIEPFLQLSNVKIPMICAREFGLSLDIFERIDLPTMQSVNYFLNEILKVQTLEQLDGCINTAPQFLQEELRILRDTARSIQYPKLLLAPLYYAPMAYYNGLLFRFFEHNQTLILGGDYEILHHRACGFGIYTDAIIQQLSNS